MKLSLRPFIFAALSAATQTNPIALTNRLEAVSNSPAETVQTQTDRGLALAPRAASLAGLREADEFGDGKEKLD